METPALAQCDHDEALFVFEYLVDFNKSAAARRIGKPEAWAATYGNRIYKRPHVRAAIDEAIGIRCKELGIDSKWVLSRLVDLYNADLSEIITHDSKGEPSFDFSRASPELLEAIEQIDIKPTKFGTSITVKLPSKKELLKIIGTHIDINAFKEHIEHSGAVQVIFDEQDKDA